MRVQQGATAVDERAHRDCSDKVEIQALPEPDPTARPLPVHGTHPQGEARQGKTPAIKITPEKEKVDIEIVEETEDEEPK
jgi:hypothetical protein